MDRQWVTRKRRSGRGLLPNLETILYAERGEVISEEGWDRGLQNERGGQGTVQVQRNSLAANLSNGTLIQVAWSDGPTRDR